MHTAAWRVLFVVRLTRPHAGGWLVHWLVGWLAGWLVGWFGGSLARDVEQFMVMA